MMIFASGANALNLLGDPVPNSGSVLSNLCASKNCVNKLR